MFHGLLVAALAGRLSRAVPLPAASPAAIAVHAPVLLLGVLVPLGLLAVVVGAVVVGASRIPQIVSALQTRRLAVVGRAALAVAGLVPGPRVRVGRRRYRGPWLVGRPPPPNPTSPTLHPT
jgi:hypothetical protein